MIQNRTNIYATLVLGLVLSTACSRNREVTAPAQPSIAGNWVLNEKDSENPIKLVMGNGRAGGFSSGEGDGRGGRGGGFGGGGGGGGRGTRGGGTGVDRGNTRGASGLAENRAKEEAVQ